LTQKQPENDNLISTIVLAAGLSTRMRQPKMTLPWKNHTIIEEVVQSLISGGCSDIYVVTGASANLIEKVLGKFPVQFTFNPDFLNGNMLFSIQAGLRDLPERSQGVLVALGDQPQIQSHIVREMIDLYRLKRSSIIVPSFQNHRGHPWIIHQKYWKEILSLKPPATMRDFFRIYSEQIHYYPVENRSILDDLDTPEAYNKGISEL
jgi:molybdenum cofactor cytidylyltransferase